MSKEKSPFVGYTVEEILASEAVTYVIQIGSEVFDVNGRFVFTKKSAGIYYNKILRQILQDLASGSKKEKQNARRLLNNFKILPLRIH